jgi:hypothetical protein
MRKQSLAVLLLTVSFAILNSPAVGAECEDLNSTPEDAETAAAILADLALDKCLGGKNKPCLSNLEPLCRAVDDFEAMQVDVTGSSSPATDKALANAFKQLPDQLIAALSPFDPEGQTLRVEMRQQFNSYLQRGDAAVTRSRYTPLGLKFFANDPAEVDLESLLKKTCATDCAAGFQRATRFYTVAALYRRSLGKLLESERIVALTYLDGLEKRWQAYFTDAYSQYPWELALNSKRYQRSSTLAEPPNRQLILAHPGAAFEVIDEDGEQRLEEALLLEAIGLYRWTYKNSQIRRPFGASLVLSWHGTTGDDVGYGVLLHLPRSWSLGFTYRDDTDFSALLSADLGKLFTNRRGLYEKVFQ